jgi:hypothetical protein
VPTYSSTYSYAPSLGDFVLNAFGRIGIRRTELTQQHLADAANEANLVQVELSNRIPNLWLAETYDVSLVAGTKTYTLAARLIAPMAVYMTVTPSGGTPYDRILTPISTTDYDAIPNKDMEATPSTYFFDRQIIPQITMWPVPPDGSDYVLHLRMISQPQDATLPNGVQPQIPYRFFDAFISALAWRLAVIYAPDKEAARLAQAERAWSLAANNDTEMTPMYVSPGIGGYYR